MTDKNKTPEEQAEHIITLLKWNPCQEPLTEREKEIARSVYLAGYAEGYEAGRPKWVKADETPPSIRKMCLGHFEVTPDYWSTPFIVFFAKTLEGTERLMFLDQCGNHLPPEFKRLLEYLELPPTKED